MKSELCNEAKMSWGEGVGGLGGRGGVKAETKGTYMDNMHVCSSL
jgi:hypothetical protein